MSPEELTPPAAQSTFIPASVKMDELDTWSSGILKNMLLNIHSTHTFLPLLSSSSPTKGIVLFKLGLLGPAHSAGLDLFLDANGFEDELVPCRIVVNRGGLTNSAVALSAPDPGELSGLDSVNEAADTSPHTLYLRPGMLPSSKCPSAVRNLALLVMSSSKYNVSA